MEEENSAAPAVYRPSTPPIDENVLQGFDSRKTKITALLASKDGKIDLTSESKPVRDVLKANYGVTYKENTMKGGQVNLKVAGQSYYAQPGRTMRKSELEAKQRSELQSKVQDFRRTSRLGDNDASGLEASLPSTSMPSRRANRYFEKQTKDHNESRFGDSLYQQSVNREGNSPIIDLPHIANTGRADKAKLKTASLKQRAHTKPNRDIVISSADHFNQIALLEKQANITVQDEKLRQVYSPKTGVTFSTGFDLGTKIGARTQRGFHKTSSFEGSESGRPSTTSYVHPMTSRGSPRGKNSSFR